MDALILRFIRPLKTKDIVNIHLIVLFFFLHAVQLYSKPTSFFLTSSFLISSISVSRLIFSLSKIDVIDAARLWPPTYEPKQSSRAFLYNLMRPEFLASYPKPLNPVTQTFPFLRSFSKSFSPNQSPKQRMLSQNLEKEIQRNKQMTKWLKKQPNFC